jgi:anthranilate/para-aminobenzoate synthase component I
MLVDLERNDLGRICRYRSVEVDTLMALEEYSHVIHIVSNVRGTLRPSVGAADLIRAVFPGGTITGCPKIRSIEIIDALEPVRRQLYTGAMGYFSDSGTVDLNLLIRTAFVTGGSVTIQAGSGIVADSDPAREYEETLHKAQALKETFLVKAISQTPAPFVLSLSKHERSSAAQIRPSTGSGRTVLIR